MNHSSARELVASIQASVPLIEAMQTLLDPGAGAHPHLAEKVSLAEVHPAFKAGLLLYLDELELSHAISQSIDTPLGAWWHAIMHRREGDYWNSHYWLDRACSHSFFIDSPVNPREMVDECDKDLRRDQPDLIRKQRQEWQALIDWMLEHEERL
jgi:hypothetical protein